MNINKISILFALIAFIFLHSQGNYNEKFPDDFVKGNVKKMIETEYKIINDSAKIRTINEYIFDESNLFENINIFDDKNKIIFSSRRFYANGYLLKLFNTSQRSKDSLIIKRDNNNLAVKIDIYGFDNAHYIYTQKYILNKNGLFIQLKRYSQGKINFEENRKFDANNNLIEKISKEPDINYSKENYYYNAQNILINKKIIGSYNNTESEINYVYQNNNLIAEISNIKESGASFLDKKEYLYDKNNNLEKIVDSGNGFSEFSDFDKYGNWKLRKDYDYQSKFIVKYERKIEYKN